MKVGDFVVVNEKSTYRRKWPNAGSYGKVVAIKQNPLGTSVYVDCKRVVAADPMYQGRAFPNTYWLSGDELDVVSEIVIELKEMQNDLQELFAKLDESDKAWELIRRERANGY